MISSLFMLFFSSVVVAFSGAMMPGPLFTATIAESGRRGFHAGPLMIAGHGILEFLLVLALLAGLAPLLSHEVTLIVFSCAGGGIMLLLSLSMWKSLPGLSLPRNVPESGNGIETDDGSANGKNGHGPLLVSGIVLSLSNPYWFLWWATIGLAWIGTGKRYGIPGIAAFFIGHLAGDLVWYSLVSAAVAGGRKLLSDRTYRILIGICASALAVFAAQFVLGGIGRIMKLAG